MWARKSLSGWGRYPVVEALCTRPERRSEVIAAVEEGGGEPVIAHGLGRSYGDVALLDGGRVILTRRLDRMLRFDPKTGWLKCETGVTIEDLIATFLPRGFFPPVVPGTQFVTVGGALANDIHGKNHHVDGSFADHVRSIELLTASGEIVTCSRESEPSLFWTTVAGVGLTGFILALELRLTRVESENIEMEAIRVADLDEFFAVSQDSADFTHTVSWIDSARTGASMGRGVFMRGRHAPEDADPDPDPLGTLVSALEPLADVRAFETNFLLNRATIALFNEAYYRKTPPGKTRSTVGYKPFFFPLDVVRNWNRLYGTRGFFQYQFVVPPDPDYLALRTVLDMFASAGMISFLSVIKEFGDSAHPFLSFPRPGVTVNLDIPNHGPELHALMDRVDDVIIEAGGRVYLGKDARMSKDRFRRMYPEWEAWKAVRDHWDPDHLFQSDLGRRLGLVGE